MLFLGAIETLSEDELRNYLAYVHAASFFTLSKEVADKPIKSAVGYIAKKMPDKHSEQPDKEESVLNHCSS